MTKGKHGKDKNVEQQMQAMAQESKNAAEHLAYTNPPIHKEMHESNRPSVGP